MRRDPSQPCGTRGEGSSGQYATSHCANGGKTAEINGNATRENDFRRTKRLRDVREHAIAPTPVGAHPRRVALVALRRARNISLGRFLFAKLFLLGLHGQKKKRSNVFRFLYGCVQNSTCRGDHCARKQQTFCVSSSLATFLFDTAGAKRKVIKRETPGIISPSADGEEGSAPSTCAHWRGDFRVLTHVA